MEIRNKLKTLLQQEIEIELSKDNLKINLLNIPNFKRRISLVCKSSNLLLNEVTQEALKRCAF
jgi:hypothetical protein